MNVQEFLTKSQENLRAAKLLLDDESYNASANRAYYAAFQAAVAALASEGIEKRGEKISHEWVQSQFSGMLIHRKKLYPATVKSLLLELQKVRDAADYEVVMIDRIRAERQYKKSTEFVLVILERMQR
jgi:uncharacterized protein